MCLGIPGQVVQILDEHDGQLALVDVQGARRKVNLGILDAPPTSGDWILIHMGFAMEVIDLPRAEQALSGLETMGRSREAADG
ncbi:MAG TPA: HypC/HybG/HupF family hydrogenase formation chaperone [Nocardioidaceae bacterium]|nr:HypC/HybG/HupF family hydrogenase formation chaperone [Nocardioidaceae bacterium]